jgi:hypothetical protein
VDLLDRLGRRGAQQVPVALDRELVFALGRRGGRIAGGARRGGLLGVWLPVLGLGAEESVKESQGVLRGVGFGDS